jgi:HEAT repeat protein
LAWAGSIDSFLNQFDSEAQCGLVLLLQNMKLPEEELQTLLLNVFEHGSDEGRLAALSALAAFSGAAVDRLVWEAAGDANPTIQVEALTQLNTRTIPNAAARIMQFVESPHEEVRDTIQKLLPNFRFNRFMQTFEQLDDERRRRMFTIVRQLDKQTPTELIKMLSSAEPLVRAKALLCIDYCNEIVPLVEDALCDILTLDEMPKLRCKAAEQLVAGRREESRMTLVQALHRDASPEVRTAAKSSLEKRPAHWHQQEAEAQS